MRPLRISFKGALYLITQGGNNRGRIFFDDDDTKDYLKLLRIYKDLYRCLLYAYVLMEDHLHLILETRQANLSRFMHTINTGYTIAFNKKYHKQGHLFQSRYKSIVIEKEGYLVELSRYIHLNPVRAGLAERPETYRWSSYRDYIGERQDHLISTEPILSRFGDTGPTQKANYRKFVQSGIDKDLSGWKKKVREQIYLGTEHFIRSIKERMEQGPGSSPRKMAENPPGISLENVLDAVSRYYGLDSKEILRRPKLREYAVMRQTVMYLARTNCRETLREIGNQLGGIKQPTVSYAIRKLGERIKEDRALRDDIRMISKELKHLRCSVTIRLEHN